MRLKAISYLLLFIGHSLLAVVLTSCGDESAGDLAGMWQMTQWQDKASNDIVKTNADGLYYCFQNHLIKFQERNNSTHYYLSYYTRTRDDIQLSNTIEYPVDTVVTTLTPLTQQFAMPEDGKFHILHLSHSQLVLETEQATLTFRKY